MTEIRAAALNDLPSMVDLLMQDAERREIHNPTLWLLADDARKRIASAGSDGLQDADWHAGSNHDHISAVTSASGFPSSVVPLE